MGAAAAAGLVGAAALRDRVSVPPPGEPPAPSRPAQAPLAAATPDVRALFGTLADGAPLSTHWRVETVHAVRAGAVPVILSTIYGGRFAVEVFRADAEGPPPVGRAGALAVHLVNGGDGSSRTAELAGLGAMALARELEGRLAAGAPVPEGLTTYRARIAADPDGSFDIPLA